MLQQA